MFELIMAKVIALSTAAKVGLATATAASIVAVGGATGVVPVLPEQAERPAAEQVSVDAPEAGEDEAGAAKARKDAARADSARAAEDKESADVGEAGDQDTPAPQSSFGARVSTDAKDGGVDGATISEEARQRPRPEQAEAGQSKAAEGQAKREQAPAGPARGEQQREQAPAGSSETAEDSDDTGDEAAERGAANGEQGREKAANAPADDDADQG